MISVLMACLVAYALGSIPTAYLITRWVSGQDIRILGDGNMGAGNVWREVHPVAGLLVAAADMLKGFIALLAANLLDLSSNALVVPGLAAVSGHAWPFTLQFWGGGGAATGAGAFLFLFPRATLLAGVIVSVLFLVTRRPTLATASGFGLVPVLAWWQGYQGALVLSSLAVPCLMGLRVWQQERAKKMAFPLPGKGPSGDGQQVTELP